MRRVARGAFLRPNHLLCTHAYGMYYTVRHFELYINIENIVALVCIVCVSVDMYIDMCLVLLLNANASNYLVVVVYSLYGHSL